MQEIKLLKLIFENFKGYKKKEIIFGNITNIQGENESGKTTIAIGYNWLFFDKDYGLKANPTVRPEKNNVTVDDVLISVEAICDVGGREVSFKKIQKQTKTKDGVVNGSANSYLINSVEKNKGDFESYIEDELGVNMGEFLACTNPNQFMGQFQKDMRPILFKMASSLTDYNVASSASDLRDLAGLLVKYTLEEVLAMNKASVSKLDKDIKGIPVRIDEVSKSIVDVDVAERELQKNELKRQISEKDRLLSDNEKICEEFQRNSDGIMDLTFKINGIVQKDTDVLIMERRELQKESDDASNTFQQIEGRHKLLLMDIDRLTKSIEINDAERKQLGVQYNDVVAMEFDNAKWIFDEKSVVCPNCGQDYPALQIDKIRAGFAENKKKAIDAFDKDKEHRKQTLLNTGTDLKNKIASDKEKLLQSEAQIEQYKNDKVEANKIQSAAMDELAKLPEKPDLSNNQEYESLCQELSAKKKAMESMNNGADYRGALKGEIETLHEELIEVEKIIASADNSKAEERIEELKKENRVFQQNKADCERILDMCDTLSKTKNELLVDEINQHFGIVKWQLFDYQMNGKYKEVCVPTVDGYRFGDSTNEGREIMAKLDICNSLQKFFGISVPIFLDGAESINDKNIPAMDCQLVLLKVTEDEILKVEVK